MIVIKTWEPRFMFKISSNIVCSNFSIAYKNIWYISILRLGISLNIKTENSAIIYISNWLFQNFASFCFQKMEVLPVASMCRNWFHSMTLYTRQCFFLLSDVTDIAIDTIVFLIFTIFSHVLRQVLTDENIWSTPESIHWRGKIF